MENRTNQIIQLEDGTEYYIMKQAVYRNENYFVVAEVSDDGEDLKEKFAILHEEKTADGSYIDFVDDPKILKVLLEHLDTDDKE